jgi:NADPH:quinone reductase-like Zn-dependent oxidoreductase
MVYHDYGPPDVLKCEEVEIPTPKENQVLRRVHSAAVNPLDCGLMKGKPHSMHFLFGFPKPKTTRPERDVLGQVEAVGRSVTRFKPGDVLFGACTAGNWMDKVDGLFAEYVCTLANALGTKPENITFEQTASAPIAALTAPMRFRDAALGCGAKTARISDPAYSGDSVAGSSRLGTRV